MPAHLPFDIEVGAGTVHGTLHRPDEGGPWPAVLVTCDLPGSHDDHDALVDDLATRLRARGVATARFAPREDDPATAADATSVIDDASAVYRWLMLREDLDGHRIGLLGRGLGAVVAACLAGRTDELKRICLLGPATNDDALGRLARGDGSGSHFDAASRAESFRTSLAALTPVADLARHGPPTLIVQPAADRVVPPECAAPYLETLELAARPVEYELVARADHAFSDAALRGLCLDRIERFFTHLSASGEKAA